MWFFNEGLGDHNGMTKKGKMKTLETMLKDNNHTNVRHEVEVGI